MDKQLDVKKEEMKVRKIIDNLDVVKAVNEEDERKNDDELVFVMKCTRAVPKSTSIGRLGHYVRKSELSR